MMVIWLNDTACSVGVEDGVVRSDDVQRLLALDDCRQSLLQQQERLLQAAREQAQALVHAAQRDAAALLEQARAEARRAVQQGYEDGRRQAVLEWHERRAGPALDRAEVMRSMHEKLAGIVTTAVERIVHSESREALYQRALHSVKALTRGASSLVLRVNAADYAHASAALVSLPALGSHGLAMEVRVDPALKPGSCVFESELGILDASLQTQLDGLRAAMERAVRLALSDSDGDALTAPDAAAPEGFPDDDVEAADADPSEEVLHG
jgi:type III secretion protein L